jgi:predicted nucleic acid-binding protein
VEVTLVTKYVIGPDVALRLAQEDTVIADEHQLMAPTLLRSQLLTMLYRAVRQGEMTREDADRYLGYVRGLRIRLLGDRVLQNVAWKVADQLGWRDTFDAEYIALTQLQADAFITLDEDLASAVKDVVELAPFGALTQR